ncbi:MAG: hypothetical protein HYT80_03835 [Euryarchaeota archaeon]|nr:hypothetical protein [Euryarchaeota archaeon]
MKTQLIAALFALAGVLSGCSGPSGSPDDATTSDAPDASPTDGTDEKDPEAAAIPTSKNAYFDFAGCSEMNFLLPVPAEDFGDAGPLTVKTSDAAGLLIDIIFTVMSCDTLDSSGRMVEKPVAVWGMVPVEAYGPLKIDGVTSYYWLGLAATSHPEIRSVLRARGVEIEKATMTLKFDQLAGNAKARGSFEGKAGDFRISAESAMVGAPANGVAGTLGLYTFKESRNTQKLWVHQVNFTAYKFYDKGAALVTPAFLPLPGIPGALEFPQPVKAYHNLDYGARFDFDRGILEK